MIMLTSSGVNRPENLSLFKYIWIERNEKGEAAIQQSLGYLGMKKKLRKQVNKNILYEKVGGI